MFPANSQEVMESEQTRDVKPEEKLWYQAFWEELAELIRLEALTARTGYSAPGVRYWIRCGRLREEGANVIADALDELAQELNSKARFLRSRFKTQRKKTGRKPIARDGAG